jgi:hypothetical protein
MLPTRYIFAYIQPYIDDRPFLEKGQSRKSKPDNRVKVINIHKFLSHAIRMGKKVSYVTVRIFAKDSLVKIIHSLVAYSEQSLVTSLT